MQSPLPSIDMAMMVSPQQQRQQQNSSFSSSGQQQRQQQQYYYNNNSDTNGTSSSSDAAGAATTTGFATNATSSEQASDTAIDAYATKLLEEKSPPDTIVDSNLGSYVTTMLRCASIKNPTKDLPQLDEYESLLELLEDQCDLTNKDDAKSVLIDIAQSVITRHIPSSTLSSSSAATSTIVGNGLYHNAGGSLDSFQSFKNNLPPIITTTATATTTTTNTTTISAGTSSSSSRNTTSSTPTPTKVTTTTTTPTTSRTRYLSSSDDTGTTANDALNTATATTTGNDDGAAMSRTITAAAGTTTATATTTPSGSLSGGGGTTPVLPSPLQATTLIPIDLMGALDDPSPHHAHQVLRQQQQQQQHQQFHGFPQDYQSSSQFDSPATTGGLPPPPQLTHRLAPSQYQQQRQQQQQHYQHFQPQQPQHHFYHTQQQQQQHQFQVQQHLRSPLSSSSHTPIPALTPQPPPPPSSVDDFPPLGGSSTTTKKTGTEKNGSMNGHGGGDAGVNDDINNATDADAFPPLGAAADTKSKRSKGKSGTAMSSTSKKKTNSSKKNQNSDETKELAAALFRPARPRQNSITERSSSGHHNVADCDSSSTGTGTTSLSYQQQQQQQQQRSRGSSLGQYSENSATTNTSRSINSTTNSNNVNTSNGSIGNNNIYYQHQIDSCTEILLSMVQDLGEEAAIAASYMSDGDFNVAHYIVDTAMNAPPVCRHILHGGCYRSDCQFSHDVDGHSCLFWLRGRCGKGSNCQFLHGFNANILDDIPQAVMDASAVAAATTMMSPSQQMPSTVYHSTNEYSSGQDYGYNPSGNMMGSPPGYSNPSYNQFQNPSSQMYQEDNPLPASSAASTNPPSSASTFSFANIASKGYDSTNHFVDTDSRRFSSTRDGNSSTNNTIPTVRIPQDLWNPHENRDAAVFHIQDPLERYQQVAATVQRQDVIDLHFQSTKTFQTVLAFMLPTKFEQERLDEVWIVTGTGHHVGTKTHQKGGGALESAVIQWLTDEGYNFAKGRDSNGLGGAILVKRY